MLWCAVVQDNVICTLENNQAFVLGLANTELLKADEMNFEPLAVPFHYQSVTGLDVCIRKPLVVSCGLDRTVRYAYTPPPLVNPLGRVFMCMHAHVWLCVAFGTI